MDLMDQLEKERSFVQSQYSGNMESNDDNDIEQIREMLVALNLGDTPSIEDIDLYNNNRSRCSIKLSNIDLDCYIDMDRTIKQLRKHNETIDLVLATIDGAFEPVHIYYLALKAPKFWCRIQNEWNRNISNDNHLLEMIELYTDEGLMIRVPKLIIPNLNGRILKIIIETMYAGQVSLDYFLTWELLQIGYEFELDFLIDTCLNYLRHHLTLRNCVLLFQVGLKFQHQLAKSSYRYLQVNLVKILQTNANVSLMHLTLNQLKTLIQDNRLNVSNEIYIWHLIYRWILFDCQKRLEHFWSLFSLIRFNLIDSKIIKSELTHDFVRMNYFHNDYLVNTYHLNKNSNVELKLFNPRIPYQIVFLYGGYEDGFPSNTVKTFDIRAKKWFRFQINQHFPRIYHKIVNYGNMIYIIGGSDGIHCLNTVIGWNLVTGKFCTMKPMLEARTFHCAVRYGRFIVVCGGNNARERLRSCEIYDPSQNSWRFIAPMNTIRSDASAAVLHNKIYVAGGIDIFALTSMEFYSFVTNSWTIVSFMHIQRRSFSLVPYKGFLFAIGGCTEVYEFNCLKTVERYNPHTNTWSFVAPLPYRRMSFSACVLEDKIFIFGGFDGFSSFRTVTLYNIVLNQWHQLWHRLPTHLSGSSAVVVSDISNAIDYSYYGRSLVNDYQICFNFFTATKKHRFGNWKKLLKYLIKESKKFKRKQYKQEKTSKKVICSKYGKINETKMVT